MQLKSYLEMDLHTRPIWAYLADILMAKKCTEKQRVPEELRKNPFLQDWKPQTKKLPKLLARMMKVAKKYAVEIDHTGLPKEALLQMPLWYHVGADMHKTQRNRSTAAKCLQDNHKISTVHDAMELLQRLEEEEHYPANFCRCQQCAHDKDELGCRNPHKCIITVAERLSQLKAHWDPTRYENRELSIEDVTLEEGDISLSPNPSNLLLLDGFRVF
ncbi:hypothetical protein EV361DRAFT_758640, partial [Lentinula raphanica]